MVIWNFKFSSITFKIMEKDVVAKRLKVAFVTAMKKGGSCGSYFIYIRISMYFISITIN
jgi:hypothetical protein